MSIIREENVRQETLQQLAEQMLIAARTAPKAKGLDSLEMFVVDKESIPEVSKKLKEQAREYGLPFFERDATNIMHAEAIVAIGTRIQPLGLNESCQYCGFANCATKEELAPQTPCVFNTGDLNLAVGSAVDLAADYKIDNRVMFTVGKGILALNWFKTDVKIALGIPLASLSKNPFFDRK